jgi:hypothetical protein
VEEVLEELEEQRLQGHLGKSLGKDIEKLINYYTDHRDRMRYATYKKEGMEIGSDAVESRPSYHHTTAGEAFRPTMDFKRRPSYIIAESYLSRR